MSITMHHLIAFALTTMLALTIILSALAFRHTSSILSSRKFMHITVGSVFVLCITLWPYSTSAERHHDGVIWSSILAGTIPMLSGIMFWLIGSGMLLSVIGRKAVMPLVDAVSRTGSLSELRRGPTIYGSLIGICTMCCFTHSPILVILVSCLSIGDGFAEATARLAERYGITYKLPWNPNKSYAGSFGFFITSIIGCCLLGQYYMYQQCWQSSITFVYYMQGAIFSCFISMLVETLPIEDIDNITVSLAAIISSYLWFTIST